MSDFDNYIRTSSCNLRDCPYGDELSCDDCVRLMIEEHDKQVRAEAVEEFADKIREYSGEHYVDCDGFGCQTELVFRTDEWLDFIVEQMKEQKNENNV